MNIEFCKECADFEKCSKNEQNCPYFEDEQTELNEKAKNLPRNYEKSVEKTKKSDKKPKTVKVSDEKVALFNEILADLEDVYDNVEILKENKLISVKIGEKIFKIDIIEQRKPK